MTPATRLRVVLGFAVLATTAAALAQDEGWEPFRERRRSAPSGRHYVVLRRTDTADTVRYALHRRRDGAAPLPDAWGLPLVHPPDAVAPDLGPDPGDERLAAGTLSPAPLQVRVLDREPAVVLFEHHAALGRGPTLALLRGDGTLGWSRTAAALLPAPPRPGTVWWEGWWVDEPRGTIILVAPGAIFRRIALADGGVEEAGPEVLLDGIRDGPPGDRTLAFDLALKYRPAGVDPLAAALLRDSGQPTAVRLRAAVAVHRAGATTADDDLPELFRTAVAPGMDRELRAFAAGHVGEVVGAPALPLLRSLLRGEADETWRPALASLQAIGKPAIPVLRAMLSDADGSLDQRGGAAHVLGALRVADAVPALWDAVDAIDHERDPDDFVPQSALGALIGIAPADLEAQLLRRLDAETPLDWRIAQYFTAHPSRAAAMPLARAMARRGEFAWERRMIVRALVAVTGEDHGNDAAAWRAAVEQDSDTQR